MHAHVNYCLSVNNLMLRAILKTEDGLEPHGWLIQAHSIGLVLGGWPRIASCAGCVLVDQ